jgi:thiamine-phosphate pyrophosphorylase
MRSYNERVSSQALLCYITDRSQFPGDEPARWRRLLDKIAEAALCGVDYIQLREKDLSTRELERLAREAMHIIAETHKEKTGPPTRLLVNSRTDVALAVGADGVHLRSQDVGAQDVRSIWGTAAREGTPARGVSRSKPVISVSCHTPDEVARAASDHADLVLFAPVFEKVVLQKEDRPDAAPAGLIALRQACTHGVPVLALGGVTLANARSCLETGAAGIAGIRLFQENSIAEVVKALRGL